MSELPTPTPSVSPETERFWEATADGELLLKRCSECERLIYYPKARCPDCSNDSTEWIEASGEGTVYSFTVVRNGRGAYADAVPYVLAYVELAEGPRIMTNVVVDDVDTVEVGQRVAVTFDDTGDGPALVRFEPVEHC